MAGSADSTLARSIRAQTGDGQEIVEVMVAIMRDDVDVLYPPKPGDRSFRRPKRSKQGKKADTVQVAAALADLLRPRRPRFVRIRDRMAAATWLADRGWGTAPPVIPDEPQQLSFDPSRLSAEEQDRLHALLVKGQPSAVPPGAQKPVPPAAARSNGNGTKSEV